MPRPSAATALRTRLANLEARLAPPAAEPNPFANVDVVGEVERCAEALRADLERISARWRTAPERSAPWEAGPPIQKLLTADTPARLEEATQLVQRLQREGRESKCEFYRRREEQYHEEYARQKRQQELAARLHPRSGRT
jgi:hypothetical protein